MKALRVLLAGSGVVFSWASAFPAIRVASPALGAFGLSIVRLTVAALALLVVARAAHVRPPERRHAWLLLAAAFFGMTAYQVLLNAGELHVPAGTASIVVASAPLVSVAIAALALREPLTVTKAAGSIVAIAGVAVVCLSRSGASVTSTIWIVVGAAVVQGIYHPLIKPLLRTRTGLEVATYAMTIGAVMALPLLPWGWERLAAAPASAWGAAVYLALVPSALGFVLWGYAVANLSMATSTSLLYLIPAVAVLIAFVWLGEAPQPSELLGGLVILAGVGLIGQGDRLRTYVRAPRAPARRPTTTTEPDAAPARPTSQRVAAHARDRDVRPPSLVSHRIVQPVPATNQTQKNRACPRSLAQAPRDPTRAQTPAATNRSNRDTT